MPIWGGVNENERERERERESPSSSSVRLSTSTLTSCGPLTLTMGLTAYTLQEREREIVGRERFVRDIVNRREGIISERRAKVGTSHASYRSERSLSLWRWSHSISHLSLDRAIEPLRSGTQRPEMNIFWYPNKIHRWNVHRFPQGCTPTAQRSWVPSPSAGLWPHSLRHSQTHATRRERNPVERNQGEKFERDFVLRCIHCAIKHHAYLREHGDVRKVEWVRLLPLFLSSSPSLFFVFS